MRWTINKFPPKTIVGIQALRAGLRGIIGGHSTVVKSIFNRKSQKMLGNLKFTPSRKGKTKNGVEPLDIIVQNWANEANCSNCPLDAPLTKTVAVEGNIGSGKSTLLKYFESSPNVETIKEPLDKWCNLDGHNVLGLLYEDMHRWSFTFNTYVQLTRLQMHNKPTNKAVRMIERSIHSTRWIFMENHHQSGKLEDVEYNILCDWFDWVESQQQAKIDLIVYVRAPPEVSYQRLIDRDRKEECGVPFEYIQDLHTLHEDWLIHKKYPVPSPVLVIDADKSLHHLEKDYEIYRKQILCGHEM